VWHVHCDFEPSFSKGNELSNKQSSKDNLESKDDELNLKSIN